MGRIPEETVAEVLAATDIVDLIGSYFPLRRMGSVFKCNCPFHNEKTPSFTVDPSRQTYKCFGCGEFGSAVGFVMNYENLPFPDAVKKLALRANISILEEAYDPEADRRRRKIARLKELNNFTARYFHRLLLRSPDAQHARDYLKSRGFSKETAQRWLIGWAPRRSESFLQALKQQGFTGNEFKNAGLGNLRDPKRPAAGLYSKFYDQLMFPIPNDYGDIVGFSGRVLRPDDKRGKYINSPETPVFNKSKLLFGLDKARKAIGKAGFALICEGQVDAIVLSEAGFENTVAPLGTAFTPEHARLLKRYTDHVTLCYDGDSAGLKAADKAFAQLATAGLPVRMILLPAGDDPDTFLKAHGPDAFRDLLENARDFFDAKLDRELQEIDLSSATQRAGITGDLADLVSKISDNLLRDATIQTLATRLRIGDSEFREAVAVARNKPTYDRQEQAPVTPKLQPTALDWNIACLCHLALRSPSAADYLCEQLEALYDSLQTTPGGSLLRTILARRPESDSPAVIHAFLSTLPEPDQLALEQTDSGSLPGDPQKAAEEACTFLLSSHFQRQEATVRSEMNQPGLSGERILQLMQDLKQAQEFLKHLDQRFIS